MTEKQENILNAALELFARDGFRSTSTSKIAKKAGVSEGLIFRHYQNKEGLLEAIMKLGEERARSLFAEAVLAQEPKEVIRKTLQIGEDMVGNQEAINFWKLQYKVKWEMEEYGEHKMEALQQALIRAFEAMNYNQPQDEAQAFLLWMDGLATRFYLQSNYNITPQIEYMKQKYHL
ncbi:TetR/AcrR family transcriptional regulator [Roseivirga sp.]|uniref:TetR/AcrR family transcriptional regulator n=1 Tax=Roseivirga sp. TaxID=1964215 RepID=UPI003B5196C5